MCISSVLRRQALRHLVVDNHHMWSMLQGTSTSFACLMGLPESCSAHLSKAKWTHHTDHVSTPACVVLHVLTPFVVLHAAARV